MGWSEDEFWKSNPRKLEACFYQYAISQGWYKTKQQIQAEKEKEEIEKRKSTEDSIKRMQEQARKL